MDLQAMLARQQAIIDEATRDNMRSLTQEEQSEFDNLQVSIEALRAITPPAKDTDIEGERTRAAEITQLCRNFDLEPDKYIADGTSVDELRAYILQEQMLNRKPISKNIKITGDRQEDFLRAAVAGLTLRAGGRVKEAVSGSEDFRTMSLGRLARETLRLDGVDDAYRLSDEQLLRQHLTASSQFANIVDQSARNVFESAYTDVETTYQEWVRTGTLVDFKPTKTYQAGSVGELMLVSENGELKHDDPYGEEGPIRQLLTYGRQFTMSRQAFINDDVSFISQLPALYAQSARLGINTLVYKTLAENPAIWDGQQMFSLSHNNICSQDGAPNIETLAEMRRIMKRQKAPGGKVNLNITPRNLIVPTSLEVAAMQLISTSVDPNAQNHNVINPFHNQFRVIADAELDDINKNGEKEWYVTADKARSPIQVDFLNGVDMPTITMHNAPAGQLGLIFDIYMDYGVSVVDYKTAVKNNG